MPTQERPKLTGLRMLRAERGLSQTDLAGLASITTAAVSELENLKRSAHPKTVRRLAKALRVQPADLYGVSSEAN